VVGELKSGEVLGSIFVRDESPKTLMEMSHKKLFVLYMSRLLHMACTINYRPMLNLIHRKVLPHKFKTLFELCFCKNSPNLVDTSTMLIGLVSDYTSQVLTLFA